MTDADLARQEWLDERAAVLWIENGWVYGTALLEAHRMWQEKVQRENASAGHGDAPGAIAGDAVGGTEGAPTAASRRPGRT